MKLESPQFILLGQVTLSPFSSTRGLIIVLGSSQPSGKAGQTNGRTKSSSYSVAYSHPLSSKSAAFQPLGIGVTREKQPVFSPSSSLTLKRQPGITFSSGALSAAAKHPFQLTGP